MQCVLQIPIAWNGGPLTAQQDPLAASDLLEFWADKMTLCLVLTQGKAAWTPEQTPFTLDPACFNRFPVFKDDICSSNLYQKEIIITVHIYIHARTQYTCLHAYMWFWILLFHLMTQLGDFSLWSYSDLPHSVPVHSVQFSRSVVSDSLRPHESQHARPPCPSPTPGVHSDSCPSRRWCHPAISSSVVPCSSCPQSLPASESFPMS